MTAEARELELVVVDRFQAADGVVVLELAPSDSEPLPEWDPGAHIDLVLGEDLKRQYSLCGDPRANRWRIGVLREVAGRGGSVQVHEELHPGTSVRVTGPRNHFPLQPAESYQFIAGGIGITPILAMIRRAEETGTPWELLYGGRTSTSMAFVDELESYGPRVRVCPQDQHGLLDLTSLLREPVPGRLVYACGPEPLLQAVESAMGEWPSESLHLERFAAKAVERSPAGDHAFDVVLRRSGLTLRVESAKSIVETLRAAGVTVETSCAEGVCGTCETAVLAGTPDHRDSVLTDAERAANDTMMLCVSRALAEPLELDI